ncbi:MAG: YybS family protein [Dethiosulfovibrio sp.]|nr:YybS family protein [Dethiosulfovibrio sp.]
MNGTKSLVESSLLTGMAVVLFLAARYLPVAGIVLSLLCPAPLVILGLRHRPKMSFVGLVVATAIVALLTGPASAISFCLGFGVLGVGLGILASRLDQAVDIMLYGVVVSLVSKLALMVVLTKMTGVNPFDPDVDQIRATMEKVFSMYGGQDLSSVKEQVEQTIKAIPLMFPAMLTMASAVDCLLSYWVSRKVLARIGGIVLPSLPPFAQWRFPKSLLWAFAFSMVILLFEGSLRDPLLSRVGLNLRLLISMMFMIQGLSLTWDYMEYRSLSRFWRITLAFLIVFIPILSQIAVVLGLTDVWANIRTRYRR